MKALKKHINKSENSLKSLLSKPRHEFTIGHYHKLRVEIKKLNALLYLLNFCSNSINRKNIYKPFRKIFRISGKIRELQQVEVFLKKHLPRNSLPVFRNNLKQLRIIKQADFFSMINSRFIKATLENFNIVSHHISGIKKKNISSFLTKKEKTIKYFIKNKVLKPKDIHKLRKQLKILNYNRKILSDDDPKKQVTSDEFLARLIGKWHDYQVLLKHINRCQDKGEIIPSEKKQIEKIKTSINLEGELVLKKINSSIAKINSKYFE